MTIVPSERCHANVALEPRCNPDSDSFELYDLQGGGDRPARRRRSTAARSPATISSCKARCSICRPARAFPSIRSRRFCRFFPPSSGATDPNDWMSTDAEVACPDPNCPTRFRITRMGMTPVQPFRGDGGAAPGRAVVTVADRRSSPRLRDLARHLRRLAARRRSWRRRPRTRRSTTSSLLPRRGSPPSTAPTSTPASRS